MAQGKSSYNAIVALVAATGSISYGYLISIVGSTLSKPDWYVYFGLTTSGPGLSRSNALIAAIQCLFYVGSLVCNLVYPYVSDRWGRRTPIAVGSVITIVGGALQTGSVHPAMFIVARFISGFGAVFFMCGVPLYQAEIAPPNFRGFLVGLHGAQIGTGTLIAQWIGVAFFHVNGSGGWRGPLAIQCLFPALILGLIWTLPESPRWLYMRSRPEDALKVLVKLHSSKSSVSHTFAEEEFKILKAQIDFESHSRLSILSILKRAPLRKRLIIGFVSMFGTQCIGTLIILAYGPVIFGTLGYGPFTIALLFAAWTVLNPIGNLIGGWLNDKVNRRTMLLIGYFGASAWMVCVAVLVKLYAGTPNKAGNSATVFFIFLDLIWITTFIEATSFIYMAELFPSYMRSQGVSLAMSGLFAISLILTAVTPTALAHIGWRYYVVFAVLAAAMFVIILVWWPETRGYTLEQIGSVFGDEVVVVETLETSVLSKRNSYEQVEEVSNVALPDSETKQAN
ncbi:uncharacterized protein A1O5_08099 [Cladophialophora psammophila CBS 110553]|uniref:Major facilitator superfamily (MFS) profile domain-containing protein n=1 Tax=Cladophialophora psammophila CBS 110553 TaxID=1182543 RepID=W9XFK6_9EURO|nr:uncharacterized protein A1O5_08099 [Cladophialophora psammophila CBS 110553]EXJ69164.1 hypothetical protein A1O5_08099 [Cladophialophora psammophila CBS 110553]